MSTGPPTWLGLRRPSLTEGTLIGLAIFALLSFATSLGAGARFIDAWDAGATYALVAMFLRLHHSSPAAMKMIAVQQDVGKWAVLVLTLVAATASLAVIAAEMPLVKEAHGFDKGIRVVLVIYTIVLSWAFIQTMFALHYAHDYYMADVHTDSERRARPSNRLTFPGDRTPTYSDFLYFSFTIGMTFQVSDVQIADSAIRRLVLAHGVVAFFYSTGILALAINLVAGLI
jgi:uncharacterized membrane protein